MSLKSLSSFLRTRLPVPEISPTMRAPWLRTFVVFVTFILVTSALGFYIHQKNMFELSPSIESDSFDYDWIAWSMLSGHGFSRDTLKPDFLALYPPLSKASTFLPPPGPVMDRPPLFCGLLALSYLAGRQFAVIRMVQCLLLACVASFIVQYLWRYLGFFSAITTILFFLIVDHRLRLMSVQILTEPLSCFIVLCLFGVLLRWINRQHFVYPVLAGFLLGLLILNLSLIHI